MVASGSTTVSRGAPWPWTASSTFSARYSAQNASHSLVHLDDRTRISSERTRTAGGSAGTRPPQPAAPEGTTCDAARKSTSACSPLPFARCRLPAKLSGPCPQRESYRKMLPAITRRPRNRLDVKATRTERTGRQLSFLLSGSGIGKLDRGESWKPGRMGTENTNDEAQQPGPLNDL